MIIILIYRNIIFKILTRKLLQILSTDRLVQHQYRAQVFNYFLVDILVQGTGHSLTKIETTPPVYFISQFSIIPTPYIFCAMHSTGQFCPSTKISGGSTMGMLSSLNNAVTTSLNVVTTVAQSTSQLINSVGQGASVAESTAIAWRLEQEQILIARLCEINQQMLSITKEDQDTAKAMLARHRI